MTAADVEEMVGTGKQYDWTKEIAAASVNQLLAVCEGNHRGFIKEHRRQRQKAKMKFENVSELFITNHFVKQIKSVLTLNAIFAA